MERIFMQKPSSSLVKLENRKKIVEYKKEAKRGAIERDFYVLIEYSCVICVIKLKVHIRKRRRRKNYFV